MDEETRGRVDAASKHLSDRFFNEPKDGQFRAATAKDVGALGVLLAALINVAGGFDTGG